MMGVRHEFQANLDDHRDFAPRVALAASSASGRTILRAGAGIFYQRLSVTMEQQALLLDGFHLRHLVVRNPIFPTVGGLDDPENQPPPSLLRIAPGLRVPYAFQASLGLEQKVGRNGSFSAEYMMLRGVRLYRQRDLNAPLPATGERPDPNFLNVDQFETSGGSKFNSLSHVPNRCVPRPAAIPFTIHILILD